MAAEPGLGVQPSAAPSSQPGVSGPGVFSVQEQPSWGTEPGCSRNKSEIAHLCATALSQPSQWADNMKGGRAVLLRCQQEIWHLSFVLTSTNLEACACLLHAISPSLGGDHSLARGRANLASCYYNSSLGLHGHRDRKLSMADAAL